LSGASKELSDREFLLGCRLYTATRQGTAALRDFNLAHVG
jgi:hypothetical protein